MDDFEEILALLVVIHAKAPYLRICQIIGNVTPTEFKWRIPGGLSVCDNYHLEDKELLTLLRKYITTRGW